MVENGENDPANQDRRCLKWILFEVKGLGRHCCLFWFRSVEPMAGFLPIPGHQVPVLSATRTQSPISGMTTAGSGHRAVEYAFSGLVDGADLKHALCKINPYQFMIHVDDSYPID